MARPYVVGVHLAPVGDAAAVAVVQVSERIERYSEYDEQLAVERALLGVARWPQPRRGEVRRRERCFSVVHLERLPLDASYKKVAATLADLFAPRALLRHAAVALDVTNVGEAAVRELEAALPQRPAVWTITPTDNDAPGTIAAPDVIALLAVLLQGQRLKIAAALPLAPLLAEELKAFTVHPGPLVAALAVACWKGQHATAPEDWPPIRAS